jgi:dissimilatory sulfite reductase related protein
MARIKVRETKEIFLDSDGFLRHASEWSHLVRDGLAKYHKIRSLTKEHHEVIVNLREMLDNYEKEDLFDEYQRRNLIPTTDRINMLFRNFGVALAVAGSMNPKKIKIEREVVAKGKARIRVFEKKIDVTQNMIKVVVDLDGFFIDSNDWTEELAQLYANTEAQEIKGELTEEHWKMIHSLRAYYYKFGVLPMLRMVQKESGLTIRRMYELFPCGPVKGACKIAGLPKPFDCV